MRDFIKPVTRLYVAVNFNGEIVNSNDFKELGPAFASSDSKARMEDGKVVEEYALHIDYDFNKQGAFSILDCSKITAEMIAKRYCEKHHISPISRSWRYRDNYENLYQVVDANNVEYHFNISRAYYADGKPRDIYGAYISIKKGEEIKSIEITNINDL